MSDDWPGKLIHSAHAGAETDAFRDWLTANGIEVSVTKYAAVYRQPDGKLRLHLHQYCLNENGKKYLDGDQPAQQNVVVTPTVPLPPELCRD